MSEAICVITPCYNPGRYLLACLRSVEALGEKIQRHIISDGLSTDGSQEVLAAFAREHPRVQWRSEKDRGQSDGLNKALAEVDTDYFGWLNADDVYLPRGMRQVIAAAPSAAAGAERRDQAPAIIYGDYVVIDGEGKVLRCRRQPTFSYWDCLHCYLTVQNVACVFNTQAVRQAGGFDTGLRFAMDYDVVLKLARAAEVRHVRAYAGAFRIHDTSKTSTLPEVYLSETAAVRARCGGARGGWRPRWARARVAMRMLAEGCVPCRVRALGIGRGEAVAAAQELSMIGRQAADASQEHPR